MANEINQELGFDVANALSNLTALGNAISNVSGRITRFGNTLEKFNAQANNLPGSLNNAGTAATSFGNQLQQTTQGVERLTTSVGLLSRIVFTQLVIKGLRLAEQSLIDATQRAAEFQIKLADIRTISDGTFGSISEIGAAVEELSIQLGTDQLEVARGLYEALGNQIGGTKEELIQFSQVTGEFAVATLTDYQESVGLLSTILNGLQIDISRTEEVASKLNKTIDLGAVTGSELAGELGRGIPQAKLLGVSLEEVLAAMSTLTRNGLSAAESMTRLIGVMTGLQKPSEALEKILRNLGVASGEQLVRSLGLAGALNAITQEAARANVPLAQVFTNIRGLAGGAILGSQQLDDFRSDLEKIEGTATSLNKERFNIVFETDAKKVEREINELRVEMTRLGTTLLATTAEAFDFVGGASAIVEAVKLATPIIAAYTANVAIMAATQRSAILSATGLGTALGGLTKFALAATIAAQAGQLLGKAIDNSRLDEFNRVESANRERVNAFVKGENERLAAARDANDKIVASSIDAARAQTRAFNTTIDSLKVDEKRLVTTATQQLDRVVGLREQMVQQLKQAAQESTQAVIDSQNRISDLRSTIDERKFDQRLLGADDNTRFLFQLQRTSELTQRAQQQLGSAVNEQQINQALKIFQQAERSGDEARSIAERLGDRRLENIAVERLNQLTQTQIQSEQQLQKIQEDRTEKAKEAAREQEAVVDAIKAQAKIVVENIPTVGLDPTEVAQRTARAQQAISEIVKQGFSQKDLSLSDALGLTKLATDLNSELKRNPFELQFQVQGGMERLVQQAQAAINRLKIEVPFDVAGLERVLGKELNSADQINTAVAQARDEAAQLASEISKAEQARSAATTGLGESIRTLTTDAREASTIQLLGGGFLGLDSQEFAQGKQLLSSIADELERLAGTSNLTKDDLSGVIQQMEKLQTIQQSIVDLPFLGNDGGGFAANLDNFALALQKLAEVAKLPSVDPQAESRLQELNAVIQASDVTASNIETALTRGATAIQTAGDNLATRLEAVLTQTGGGQVPGFANGGFARGTDTALAALTPGEVVMNPQASQRWFSDLQRMNAGMQPQFRNNGGPVQSVGDIHITINESKTPQATVDEVWRGLQRRFRIGALSPK